jgi:hypothetical protein
MASTNIESPIWLWTPVATNLFDGSHGFQYTHAISLGLPAQFLRGVSGSELRTPIEPQINAPGR